MAESEGHFFPLRPSFAIYLVSFVYVWIFGVCDLSAFRRRLQ
jgi:hypothetical protein